jgi:hypothetical protein
VKKSTSVAAPLLASVALAFLAGCREREMKRCVDQKNTVVDDSFCATQQQTQQTQQPNPVGGFYPYPFRWYYGGWGGYSSGSVVGGGGFSPVAGHAYASPTTRGGFGSSFSGSGDSGAGE